MTTLAVYIVFLALAFAGRVAFQYRIAGDHGFRVAKLLSSASALWRGMLLAVVLVGTLVLSFLHAIGMVQPQVDFGTPGWLAGVTAALAGVALTVVSQYQMGSAWRIGIDESEATELVTHGLYSRIRNPIYSGMLVFWIGLLLLLPHLYMALFVLAGYVAIELHVRRLEEPHLRRQHGGAYEKYFERTGRYLPKLKRRQA